MNKTLNLLKLLVAFFLVGIIFSCEYSVEEELIAIDNPDNPDDSDDSDGDGDNPPNAAATFAADVKPIIDARCVSCHGGNISPNLSTYQGVSSNASIVKSEVASRSMPQGSALTQAQIDAIVSWVDNGAKND